MTCRNWECGVVIPVETATDAGSSSETGTGSRSEADWIRTLTTPGTAGGDGGGGGGAVPVSVPVPMRVPGRRYGPNEEPWFYAGSS